MKSFKEFLMEADNQDQDFEILNSLKEFLENFDTKKDDNIDQEIIVKYLICKSLQRKDFIFSKAKEKYINDLKNLENKCKEFFNNEDLGDKFESIDNYILGKYKKRTGNLLLTKTNEIKLILDSEYATLDKFLKKAEEEINQKLEATEKSDNDSNSDNNSDSSNSSNNDNNTNDNNSKDDSSSDNNSDSNDNSDYSDNSNNNRNNDGTTRQGSYLGRFTSAQMEDIMSGNEDKITNALGVMAKAAKDRCDELLRQVKEKVEKNSKYLEEEETAQKVLWEGIFNRLPKQEKLKVQKQHGTKSIYKDEDNQKLIEVINNYKDQIDKLVDTTVSNCLPLGEKLHAFNTSAKMEDKLKEQLRMNVRNFINKMYDITLEVEKASRKSGFFENKKIEKGSKKEEEWNNFKNSDKGENFDKQLNEKTIALKKELSKILPNIQKVSSEADMNVKLVSKLIKDSSDAKDFLKKASLKKVYEKGKPIFILDWLYKKGIPVPLRTAISDKYSKNLAVVSWNELFKDKEFLNNLNGYGKSWENFKIALGTLKTLEDFKKFKEQYGKEFEVEITILCKKFIELEKQQQNGNGGTGGAGAGNNGAGNNGAGNNGGTVDDDYYDKLYYGDKNKEDNDTKKNKKNIEDISKIDWNNWNMSVTTNSCDGLPTGARKYSKAVRRRMNYALNKYL